MFGDRLGEFSGSSIEHLVPRYPPPADFGMEDAAVEVERFGERRALGTQTPEVCRMVGIALDGDGAFVIDAGNHAAADAAIGTGGPGFNRSEEHTSELQSLMRISYAVFCLKKKKKQKQHILK